METGREIKGVRGFTLVEMLTLIACVVLLMIVLVPALAKAKSKSQRADCQDHLKQIGLADRTWEGDRTNQQPEALSADRDGSIPWPAGRAVNSGATANWNGARLAPRRGTHPRPGV